MSIDVSQIVNTAVKRLEDLTGVKLEQEEINSVLRESIHILIHELAHKISRKSTPWIDTLPDTEHLFVDEILARLVERTVTEKLNLPVETLDEQCHELKSYGIKISPLRYKAIHEEWARHVRGKGSLEEFTKKLAAKAQHSKDL